MIQKKALFFLFLIGISFLPSIAYACLIPHYSPYHYGQVLVLWITIFLSLVFLIFTSVYLVLFYISKKEQVRKKLKKSLWIFLGIFIVGICSWLLLLYLNKTYIAEIAAERAVCTIQCQELRKNDPMARCECENDDRWSCGYSI